MQWGGTPFRGTPPHWARVIVSLRHAETFQTIHWFSPEVRHFSPENLSKTAECHGDAAAPVHCVWSFPALPGADRALTSRSPACPSQHTAESSQSLQGTHPPWLPRWARAWSPAHWSGALRQPRQQIRSPRAQPAPHARHVVRGYRQISSEKSEDIRHLPHPAPDESTPIPRIIIFRIYCV